MNKKKKEDRGTLPLRERRELRASSDIVLGKGGEEEEKKERAVSKPLKLGQKGKRKRNGEIFNGIYTFKRKKEERGKVLI